MGRPLSEEETAQVAAYLGDAEVLIRSRVLDLDDRLLDTNYVDIVRMVECNAVLSLVNAASGIRIEPAADSSVTQGNLPSSNNARAYISARDWALLEGQGNTVVSIRPQFDRHRVPHSHLRHHHW